MIRKKLWACTLAAAALFALSSAQSQVLDEESVAALPDEQKLDDTLRARERVSTAVAQIEELVESVQNSDSTPSQIRCVSEKLTTANAFLRVATDSGARIAAAIGDSDNSDDHTAGLHYMLVMVADNRVATLQAQAQQCAGVALEFRGQAERSVDIRSMAPGYDSSDLSDNSGGAFLIIEDVPPPTSAVR